MKQPLEILQGSTGIYTPNARRRFFFYILVSYLTTSVKQTSMQHAFNFFFIRQDYSVRKILSGRHS